MFEHLKIENLNGLRQAELRNLGKVNIICGRNNSGKSTLLHGLNDLTKRSEGHRFDQDDVDMIYTQTLLVSNLNDFAQQVHSRYKELLTNNFLSKTIYKNAIDTLVQEIVKTLFSSGSLRIYNYGDFSKIIRSRIIEITDSVILIPPKRQIETEVTISTGSSVSANGSGILNRLFRAKNRPSDDTDKKMYNNLVNAFTTISSGWSFEIFAEPNNDVSLNFSFKNQAWRGASTCGHGLQDLLVLLFFALSEYKIVLLEEPENHLHPEMQRKLLAFLKEKTDKQYFITTHSNVFLDNSYVDRVFFTSFQDSIQVDDATSRASIPADLGYNVSDNLVSDLVILIEGPTDAPVIEEFLIKYDLKSRYNIKTWPLGGHIMNQLDLSVFSQSFKLIALIDSDPGSNGVRNKFVEKCEKNKVEIHKLERYAIENYFPLHVLRDVFSTQIPEDITEITPGQKLEDQVGLNVKNNNRKIARKMQLEDIKGTDLEQFFIRVKELCQS